MAGVGLEIRGIARGLFRAKSAAACAMLAIAIGVGANVAAFGVLRGLLFRSLPYPAADRLVFVWECTLDGSKRYSTLAHFEHWRQQTHVLRSVSALKDASKDIHFDLMQSPEAQRISGARVLPNYFTVLGVQAARGRLFSSEDAAVDEVVLSDGLWTRAFGSAADIVGQKIILGDQPRVVAGVMGPDFVFAYDSRFWTNRQIKGIDFWVPLRLPPPGDGQWREAANRVIARLRDDVSVADAEAALNARWAESPLFRAARPTSVCLVPFNREHTAAFAPALWLLFFGTTLVMLIAAANLVAVVVARAVGTDREEACRMALGARAIHLVRRFSVEGLLLSLPGGLGAVLLATVTLLGLRSLLPVWIPAADRLTIDLTTIAFGVIVMTTVGVAAGTVTAILFAKRSIGARLSGGIGITLGGLGSRVWSTLVVVQIGLACTLAVLSLQASQAYAQMRNIRIGYTPTDLHTFTVALGVRHGGIDAQVSLVESIRSAIASLPTVRGVAVADHAPLRSIGGLMLFELPRDRGRGEYSTAKRLVDERYFPLLRTSITAGRGFLPTDGPGAPWVAVVNTAFSRRYLRGHGLGESLVFGGREPATIVGIVEDVRDVSARSAAEPTVYFSLRQCLSEPSNERIRLPSSFHFLIAGRSAERELWRGVRQAVSTVDRGLPIQEPASLERDLQIATSDHRLGAGVLTFLAACAILLASTGVYGVCFYSISQRSRELAIRMSLGATSGMLYRMLLVETVKRAGTGLALFIPASAALGSAIRAQLFDAVAPTPMMMMMASLAVVFSTVVATFLASRIVVHLAPAVALHRE